MPCAGFVVEFNIFRIVLFAVFFVFIDIVFRIGGVVFIDVVFRIGGVVVLDRRRVVIGRVDIVEVRGDGDSPEGL